jgi:hypothetical protein
VNLEQAKNIQNKLNQGMACTKQNLIFGINVLGIVLHLEAQKGNKQPLQAAKKAQKSKKRVKLR